MDENSEEPQTIDEMVSSYLTFGHEGKLGHIAAVLADPSTAIRLLNADAVHQSPDQRFVPRLVLFLANFVRTQPNCLLYMLLRTWDNVLVRTYADATQWAGNGGVIDQRFQIEYPTVHRRIDYVAVHLNLWGTEHHTVAALTLFSLLLKDFKAVSHPAWRDAVAARALLSQPALPLIGYPIPPEILKYVLGQIKSKTPV